MSRWSFDEMGDLGFSEEDRFARIAESDEAVDPIGHGLSAGPELVQVVDSATYWQPAALITGSLPAGLVATRAASEPRIWGLDLPQGARVRASGSLLLREDSLYADTRVEPVKLRVTIGADDFRIELDRKLFLDRVEPAISPALKRVLEAAKPSLPLMVPPSIEQLAAGFALEPWLVAEHAALAHRSSNLDRAASAGLVARLWRPDRTELARAFAAAREGRPTPATVAVQWFRGLAEVLRDSIEAELVASLPVLTDGICELERSVVEGEDITAVALALLHRRDDLESAAMLLSAADRPAAREGLEQLDRLLSSHHALWSDVALPADARLEAVAREEPDAWWGSLTVG